MRRVLVASLASALMAGSLAGVAVALETEQTYIDFAVCRDITVVSHPSPDGLGAFSCGPTAGSEEAGFGDNTDAGVFCLDDNPLGVLIHVKGEPDDFAPMGEGVSGPVTATVTPGAGGDLVTVVSETTNFEGLVVIPLGNFDAGPYEITVVFEGTTVQTPQGEREYLPSQWTATFEVQDCPEPPPPGKPGCGFGDMNHQHDGPPPTTDRYDPAVCPEQAGG